MPDSLYGPSTRSNFLGFLINQTFMRKNRSLSYEICLVYKIITNKNMSVLTLIFENSQMTEDRRLKLKSWT